MEKKLTIGMAHFTDFNGVYFSIQDIIKELIFNGRHDLIQQIEFLVVENNSDCLHAKSVKKLASQARGLIRVLDLDEKQGTSCARNKIIEEARTNFVLVMDCHVMLCPVVKTIEQLLYFISYNDKSEDLFTGPLVYDSMVNISTHFNDEWDSGMWGRWGESWKCVCDSFDFSVINNNNKCEFVALNTQERISKCGYCERKFPDIPFAGHQGALSQEGYNRSGFDNKEKPLEVFAQGLGLFLTRKNSWLKFNSNTSGFGGEECYIHEKYRMAGKKCICLPFLKWLHRFERPDGVKYELSVDTKIKNYILEFNEIGLSLDPIKNHFVGDMNFPEESWNRLLEDVGGGHIENKEDLNIQSKISILEEQLRLLQQEKQQGCCKNKKKNKVPVRS